MSFIHVNNLTFAYKEENDVIKNVSFDVQKGEWISIIGHNGSGKSTLARLLVGLLESKSGEIIIDGLNLNQNNLYEIRKKIGIVFQNPDNQFVGTNVEDDIAFGMENLMVEQKEMVERIDYFLEKVNMSEYRYTEPMNLSGGQKQRVAIAGILAMSTNIIIFDEATSMLDPEGRNEILALLKKLNDDGLTIITITHDMDEALFADKLLVLKNGQVIAFDKKEEIIKNEELLLMANLELPTTLKIYYGLLKNNYQNKEVLSYLWELSLKK